MKSWVRHCESDPCDNHREAENSGTQKCMTGKCGTSKSKGKLKRQAFSCPTLTSQSRSSELTCVPIGHLQRSTVDNQADVYQSDARGKEGVQLVNESCVKVCPNHHHLFCSANAIDK